MTKFLPGPDADIEALRRFALVKLVVADLDGTLFPSELAGTAQRLLRQLSVAGVQLTVATGRTYSGVRDLLFHLQTTPVRPLIKRRTPLILYNGSVVVAAGTGELQMQKIITKASLDIVLETAARHPCEVFAYCCSPEIFHQSDEPGLFEHVYGWQFNSRDVVRSEREFNGLPIEWKVTHPSSIRLEPCAVLVKSSLPQTLAALAGELEPINGFNITRSGSDYLELRPPGSNKGVALAWSAQLLGLSAEQVLAIGDNDNDVEMLEWAGTGVAVSTASNSARKHADFLCQFGPFQGVVQVLRLVHQAHRYFRNYAQPHPVAT